MASLPSDEGVAVRWVSAPSDELLFTAEVAAKRLHLRESTLRSWAREGKVPHRRLGRALRFSEGDLQEIVEGAAQPCRAVVAVAIPMPLPRIPRRRSLKR